MLASFQTTLGGLEAEEVRVRSERFGPNLLPTLRGPSPLRQLAGQFVHFFALILWIAAVLASIAKMPQLAIAIVAVVIVNGVFAFVQEYRADRATHELTKLLPQFASVIRSGRKTKVSAASLVPGDLVVLAEGDRISADARIARAEDLRVDLSVLTGESETAERTSAAMTARPASVTDASNLVFAGSFVTSGSGAAVIVATGAQTHLGSIAHLTSGVARRPVPLRADLNRAVRMIASVAIATGTVFFGVSMTLGMSARNGFLFGVGVIVALVPEGLLPTLTLSMAMSARRMATRHALVRHLEAVETLGATTVICSDKTGTLTANQMTARVLAASGLHVQVSGVGYDPAGTLLDGARPLSPDELSILAPLLHVAALCGDAFVQQGNRGWSCVGDPTEGALLVLARKGGIDRESEERAAPRVAEFPFDSRRRRMSTVHALPTGGYEVLAKGSPESILEVATSIRRDGVSVPLTDDEVARVQHDVKLLAHDGLRVLALARRTTTSIPVSAAFAEAGVEVLGVIGLEDPVRADVPGALQRCRAAGIRVVMVTGDHAETAAAVAVRAGLPMGRILLGSDLPDDETALADLLEDEGVSVLARIEPEEKLRIATALQARGHVVAMTGDGVNDAPALRRADIGIAMGRSGTDVAREAADVVLLDDSFSHIVEAIEEGRAAFDNIRRFLTYHLTDNVAELTPFVVWALSGGRIPLVLGVVQILALDIGTDLFPAVALGAEPPEAGTMARPPRARTARIMDRGVLVRAFGSLGPIEAVLAIAMLPLGAALFFGWHPGEALPARGVHLATLSTMVFATIVMCQMANALECRNETTSPWTMGVFGNRLLSFAIATEIAMLAAFLYLQPLADALGQRGLGVREWIPVAVAPVVFVAAEEARKAVARRRPNAASARLPRRR